MTLTMIRYRQVTIADDGTVIGKQEQDGRWSAFIYPLDLLWIESAWKIPRATQQMFLLQDGFGSPGFLERGEAPINGARRSTPEARARMLAVARRHVTDEQMAAQLGLTVDVLHQVLSTAYGA